MNNFQSHIDKLHIKTNVNKGVSSTRLQFLTSLDFQM